MKVPFTADTKNSSPITCTTINHSSNPSVRSPYEPKSVLELRSSPSPITDEKPNSNTASNNLSEPPPKSDEDHALSNHHMEDWDSLMKELGLHDDLIPVSQLNSDDDQIAEIQYPNLPELSPVSSFDSIQFPPASAGVHSDIPAYTSLHLNQPTGEVDTCNWNVGFDCVDELIRLAECFETNSYQLGNLLLSRLNQRLRSPVGKPLQRAAFYFKEALQSVLTGSTRLNRAANSLEIVQTIKAQNIFSIISPISLFSSFTANQAILDVLDGSVNVHVIDFDIGFGDHWASFMQEFADKADSRKSIRISAVVPEEYGVESRLIREILCQFANELNLGFEIDFVSIRTFEYLFFNSIKFTEGEKVAVLLSTEILRFIGAEFMTDLRRVSPDVVVLVDVGSNTCLGSSSYRQTVIDGLEFYSTLLESLEAAEYNGGGDWMRRIEAFLLFPKIVERVEAVGRRTAALKETLVAAGLTQVRLSQFAEFQAECLLRRLRVQGFNVVKRQGEMVLCWHNRPLVATSAWGLHAWDYDDQMHVTSS